MSLTDTTTRRATVLVRWQSARSAMYRANVIESQGTLPPHFRKSFTSPWCARLVAFAVETLKKRATASGNELMAADCTAVVNAHGCRTVSDSPAPSSTAATDKQ